LPHVVRWNATVVADRYAELVPGTSPSTAAEALAQMLERFADAAGLGGTLRDHGITSDALDDLASLAATQWTGTFNPRPFDKAGALEIYRAAC
jgi:alcohol dehydrogenase class IV